ncbi:DNA mismatch repair protein MutS [Muribaculaceae bacterium Isolate-013 (NCI)]|nr:DNA mismatch repair protein MutS [Muribaculaceae bacterium Isolate-013 (NCI)]
MAKKVVETPLMKQYFEMKRKHPDAVLLFRVGDFYETFSDDAVTASEILGITLTRRANGSASSVELAGFPHHALDTYLPRLIRAGKRVAICEQLEDPKTVKNRMVRRGITELVTPGVALGDNVLSHRENNFLAALHFSREAEVGVALLDISTGEFMAAQGSVDYVDKLLGNFAPKEVLVERGCRQRLDSFNGRYLAFELEDWVFTPQAAGDRLLKQFETASLKGFGITGIPLAVVAAGAILHYLDLTHHTHTGHITRLSRIEEDRYVRLDKFTIRNLELLQSLGDEGKSLLSVLDRTVSPMGARMLRRWITFPLKDPVNINRRLDIVEHFFRDPEGRDSLVELLGRIGDLERLVGKVATGRITPREVVQLRMALEALEPVKRICQGSDLDALRSMGEQLNPCPLIRDRIRREVLENAPNALGRGTPVIAPGVDTELDELRAISTQGKEYLEKIRQREIEATGIGSLKIGYNNVFGYYIEVTNTHRDKVPDGWIRKQTLVNAERYITPELKEYEEKILTAQERIEVLENKLYASLVGALNDYVPAIQADAKVLARLDCLLALTVCARENRYCRPVVDDSLEISITAGRHPVIERELPPGTPYIANSLTLDNAGEQVMMITGPNMSGKSALLRSTALNVLMAQIGSFVAADAAHIGVVDKIFTRVGASDNISLGESTFMVEMNEAASILNNLSERSLILFDELGRGTSTYDGISIAWAIVEHINASPLRPKTLFATHYHELNEMEALYPGVVNYSVAVKEIDGKVVFLRKLQRGGSEHSFGIHVARLAGMPRSIVERAATVLRQLEEANRRQGAIDTASPAVSQPVATAAITPSAKSSAVAAGSGKHPRQEAAPDGMQLSFFQLDDPVLEQIRDELLGLDINNLSPLQALNKLSTLREILQGR